PEAVSERATAPGNLEVGVKADHHVINGVGLVTEIDEVQETRTDTAAHIEASPPLPAGRIGRRVQVPFATQGAVDECPIEVPQSNQANYSGPRGLGGDIGTKTAYEGHLGVGPGVIEDVTEAEIHGPGGINGRVEEQAATASANVPTGFHDVVKNAAS